MPITNNPTKQKENVDPANQQQQRCYTATYLALPVVDSGANDNPAALIQSNDLIHIDHVIGATRQYKSRKALKELGLATDDEVLRAKMRKHNISLETYGSIPLPCSEAGIMQQMMNFQNTIQESLQNNQAILLAHMDARIGGLEERMNARIGGLEERIGGMEEGMNRLEQAVNVIAVQSGRSMNRTIFHPERITPIPNRNGNVPEAENFPQTVQDLLNMDRQQIRYLTNFYAIQIGRAATLDKRKEALQIYLGCRVGLERT